MGILDRRTATGGIAPHFWEAISGSLPRAAAGILLLGVLTLSGQVVPGRYVVELSGDPAAVSMVKQGSRFAARSAGFPLRRAAVRTSQSDARRGVVAHGGTVLDSMDTVVNALIVNIPDARAAELLQVPGVVRVHPVRRVQLSLDHALPLHKVPDAWATLPLGRDSAGAGIKIGIIDTGIDVNNPGFSDPLPALAGFPKVFANTDTQFTNAKIIVARNYTQLLPDGGDADADDHVGHGSGTAMAAAGGSTFGPSGPLSGVAPKAYLGNYKVSDANGSTFDVVSKAVDDAVADGMDVLNLSLGSYVTSYSDVDPNGFALAALENATRAGVVVTVSAGNDGPGATTIQNLASAPDVIAVGAIRNDRVLGYAITAGGASYQGYIGNGANPGVAVSGPLFDVAALDPTGLACSALPTGSVSGMVVLVLRGDCFFENKMDNVAAGGAVAVIIYNSATGTPFQSGSQGVGAATIPTLFLNQADGLDLKSRIASAGGLTGTLDFSHNSPFAQTPDLTSFSSRGPNLAAAMKPDLVAVGQDIVTAAQKSYPAGELYDPSGFIDTAGTSYSAPLTAGAAAVLKAARPGLTGDQYRSLLINNADAATSAPGQPATVQQAGAGVLNVAAAVVGTVTAYPTSLNFGTGRGAIEQSLTLALSNIGVGSDTYNVVAIPVGNSPTPTVSLSTFSLDPGVMQSISLVVSASSLAAGEYQGYVQVSGASGKKPITIPYWFAVPGSTPAGISIIHVDRSDSAHSTATGAVIFRVVDIAGLPYSGSSTPGVSVSSGGGTVRQVYRTGSVPGTFAVDLRTGTSTMQVDISIGDSTASVLIPIQ